MRATDCSSTRSSDDLFQAADEDAARLVQHLGLDAGGNQTGDAVRQGLAVDEVSSFRMTSSDGQPFMRQ
jgi:hypothetical protein